MTTPPAPGPRGAPPTHPRALARREAGFAPPSLEERRGTVLAPAPCVSGRGATVSAPARGPLCACAVGLPPSRGARLSQSVRRSLSSEEERRGDFGEPAAGLFPLPSQSPVPHLSSSLSRLCLRSHGRAVGSHSVPVRLLVVLRGRVLCARWWQREPGSLPRPGDEELRLLLCG